ncbi:unnamed protein product [Gongylonema pulchrum]|uniref:Uncharacterized protein n=1 Tax=Gongylonema pulchrum TaxID=637853 RepID=A0A183ENS7_9BILA|nr:unnamed protein product [Gongylonema pulchrum]
MHRMIPTICHLMVDPNIDVREAAGSTLVAIFWHLGENVAASIRKRQLIPEPKVPCAHFFPSLCHQRLSERFVHLHSLYVGNADNCFWARNIAYTIMVLVILATLPHPHH